MQLHKFAKKKSFARRVGITDHEENFLR